MLLQRQKLPVFLNQKSIITETGNHDEKNSFNLKKEFVGESNYS